MKTFKIILTSFVITAGLIKGAPALAETVPAQNVSIVHTADLDLSSKSGQQALNRRLITAAFEVCGTASDADLAGKNQVRACRVDVLAKARADSDQLASKGRPIFVATAR